MNEVKNRYMYIFSIISSFDKLENYPSFRFRLQELPMPVNLPSSSILGSVKGVSGRAFTLGSRFAE